MAIPFGAKQLKNPTPSNVSNIVGVSTIVLGSVIAWLGAGQGFISAGTSSNIQSIAGLLLMILNGLKPFFGVKPTGDTVPVENVTAMDAPKE